MADFALLANNWRRAGVVINEIHYNPDLAYELVEFIELYNPSDKAVDLSGWYFTGVTYTFPPGAQIAAKGYVVVTEDPTPAYVDVTVSGKYGTNPSIVYGPFTGNLDNEGEQIELKNADGVEIDQVDYQLGFPWPTVGDAVPETSPGTGHSIQLVNPSFDNDLGGNWRSAYPTPGAANSAVYATNLPPCIRQVEHSPKQPKANQVVTITAKVTDDDGVASVTLKYQLNDPGSYIPITLPNYPTTNPATIPNPAYETGWNNLAMHDDGLNGDVLAGDGIYTVHIPAGTQTNRRLVRYRITVVDTGARSLTVPYSDDPQPNFAYFVYDGVPAWTGDGVTYNTEVLTSLPVYHLIAREQDVIQSQYEVDTTLYYWGGTLVYDGDVYDNVHYRIRAQYSTWQVGKNKWKLDFNRGHYFQACDDYGEKYKEKWDKMCVGTGACPWWKYPHPDGGWDQGTMGMAMNEVLGWRLYRLAGVPASNTNYFHFRIIDNALEADPSSQYAGDFWGLYFTIENPDGHFLDERGLPDGNFYRMEGAPNEKNQGSTQVTDDSDVYSFTSSSTGYNKTGPYQTLSWWQTNVELETYYSSKAVGVGINDSDRRPEYNCSFYHNPETNKWTMIPWDLDLTYEWGSHYTDWEHFRFVLSYEQCNIAYKNRAREILDLLLNSDQAWQLIDEIASIIGTAYDGKRFMDAECAMWNYHPRMVK
ncbi:MAG: lamin tail domain-containing protein, partial [Sedimentisphaerales bacterium]|nr:lamin tail domain-containing protein [Sedimentisphaerales bacterium]